MITELDRIYENIERLLEINKTNAQKKIGGIDEATALQKANEEGIKYLGKSGNGQYLGTDAEDGQTVTHYYNTEYKRFVKYNNTQIPAKVKFPYNGEQNIQPKQNSEVLQQKQTPQEKSSPTEEPNNTSTTQSINSENVEEATSDNNSDVNFNYRFNDVIENPQIQTEINKEQEPISAIEIQAGNDNQQKIVLMGESIENPIDVPDFLKKYMEAKELRALNAGNSTTLNPYFSKEIQNQLASKGKEITKLLLSTDGEVLFLDKTGRQVMIDKPEEHTETEENNNNEPQGKEISMSVKMSELKALVPTMQESLESAKNEIEKFTFEGKEGYKVTINELRLGKVLPGGVLNEANEVKKEEKEEEEEKEKEEKTPQTTDDCEIYIMETFTISRVEEQQEQQEETQQEQQEETQQETSQEKTEEDINPADMDDEDYINAVHTAESKTTEFENVLREVQSILREADDEVSSEAEAEKASEINEEDIKELLISSREQVINFLNQGNLELSYKTKDETTFTGNKKQTTKFTVTKGSDSKVGLKNFKLGERCEAWFTIILMKDNAEDTKGTKFNRVMSTVSGVANVINSMNSNTRKTDKI